MSERVGGDDRAVCVADRNGRRYLPTGLRAAGVKTEARRAERSEGLDADEHRSKISHRRTLVRNASIPSGLFISMSRQRRSSAFAMAYEAYKDA